VRISGGVCRHDEVVAIAATAEEDADGSLVVDAARPREQRTETGRSQGRGGPETKELSTVHVHTSPLNLEFGAAGKQVDRRGRTSGTIRSNGI
ncbi:hypothetical protein BW893_30355, partial [Bacillus wiedmannii]